MSSRLKNVNMRVIASAMGQANINAQTKLTFTQAYRPGKNSIEPLVGAAKTELKKNVSRLVKLITILEFAKVDIDIGQVLTKAIRRRCRSIFQLLSRLVVDKTGSTNFDTNISLFEDTVLKILKETVPRLPADNVATHTQVLKWFKFVVFQAIYMSEYVDNLHPLESMLGLRTYFLEIRGLSEDEVDELRDLHTNHLFDVLLTKRPSLKKNYFQELDDFPIFTDYATGSAAFKRLVPGKPKRSKRRTSSPPPQLPEGLLKPLFPHPSYRHKGIRSAAAAKRPVRRRLAFLD